VKRYAFAALGVLCAGLGLNGMTATIHTHDPINFLITDALGVGSWRSFAAARRHALAAAAADHP
jgi:hypothetical protein